MSAAQPGIDTAPLASASPVAPVAKLVEITPYEVQYPLEALLRGLAQAPESKIARLEVRMERLQESLCTASAPSC